MPIEKKKKKKIGFMYYPNQYPILFTHDILGKYPKVLGWVGLGWVEYPLPIGFGIGYTHMR